MRLLDAKAIAALARQCKAVTSELQALALRHTAVRVHARYADAFPAWAACLRVCVRRRCVCDAWLAAQREPGAAAVVAEGRIRAAHAAVARVEAVAGEVPALLGRLAALRRVHEEAASFA